MCSPARMPYRAACKLSVPAAGGVFDSKRTNMQKIDAKTLDGLPITEGMRAYWFSKSQKILRVGTIVTIWNGDAVELKYDTGTSRRVYIARLYGDRTTALRDLHALLQEQIRTAESIRDDLVQRFGEEGLAQ